MANNHIEEMQIKNEISSQYQRISERQKQVAGSNQNYQNPVAGSNWFNPSVNYI